MERRLLAPREGFVEKVEALGLLFHTFEGKPYWHEGACYVFTEAEIDTIENASNELHARCLDAVSHLIETQQLARLGIPHEAHDLIAHSFREGAESLYGRFDLALTADGTPKLLEYNADTPTSLLEAAVIQWHWLQDIAPEMDQFNSIWEGLVEQWTALRTSRRLRTEAVHFTCVDIIEDLMTTTVLMDTAHEAGLKTEFLFLPQIRWSSEYSHFAGEHYEPIAALFKLYPWEWLVRDTFGPHALATYGEMDWIEPIWKMVLSNKAILAVLWELFPEHPNLLPAHLDGPRSLTRYVQKPILGREGSNVKIVLDGNEQSKPGPYGAEGYVFQAYSALPEFDGNHAVVGSWIIGGEARGIGIRESDGPITEDLARFVPHYFVPAAETKTL